MTTETETERGDREITRTAIEDAMTTESAIIAVPEIRHATDDETRAVSAVDAPARATANHATRTATANQKKRNPLLLLLRLLLHPLSP